MTTSPRFLADHDFNEHILAGCNRLEPLVEFVRARHAGLRHAADGNVLQYAEAHGLCVVSHDVNTMTAAAKARLERGQSSRACSSFVRQCRCGLQSKASCWSGLPAASRNGGTWSPFCPSERGQRFSSAITAVPEPSTYVMLAIAGGIAAVAARRRRKA